MCQNATPSHRQKFVSRMHRVPPWNVGLCVKLYGFPPYVRDALRLKFMALQICTLGSIIKEMKPL